MTRAVEESNRRLLRARDAINRDYVKPLNIQALARIAYVSSLVFGGNIPGAPGLTQQLERADRVRALSASLD
jgi:hypothetical protein